MFGQAPASSPFGAPAPAAFGAPAPAPFGGFGQPAPAPAVGGFGAAPAAPSAFGTTTTAFGQPAAAPSTFGVAAPTGAFGQPAPAPAFGAPTSAFGQPAPAPVFGAPAPAAAGGLFGAPAPATAPFGSPSPATTFGAKPAGGGLFGNAPAAPSGGLFGSAPTPAAGALFGGAPTAAPFGSTTPATPFGAPAATPTAFGAPTPSAFGAPVPAPAGAFGAAPAAGGFGQPQQTQTGSMMAPYQTTSKADGTNQIILQSITAMPQYEQKSFEELRLEDYLAGNKGSKGQAAPTATGFGATPSFGGFGAAPQPAPAFGQPVPAPAFGAPAPATGGLFGNAPAASPAGGLFGAPTPAPAFGQPASTPAFGAPAPATGGLFGTPAPAPAGGLFGAAPTPAPAFGQPAPAPAFGAPAPATGGLFGAPAPAPTGSLFGAPAPAPAFGQPAPAPAFGAPAPATGSLFGAPAPTPAAGGIFGATPAPATGGLFGQPAPTPAPSLFGQPAPAPTAGGLFGAPTPSKPGGLFGAPAPSSGSLFSQTQAPATGGLFGSTPLATVAVVPPPSADTLLAQQLAAVENKKKQLELLDAWRGNPPSGSKVLPTSQYDERDLGNEWISGGRSYAASSSALLSYRAAPRSTAKIRPRGYTHSKQSPISLGRTAGSPILSPNRFAASATKTLFIKPNSLTPKPKTRLLLTNGTLNGNNDSPAATLENGTNTSPSESKIPAQELNGFISRTGLLEKSKSSTSPVASQAIGSPSTPADDYYRQVVDLSGSSPSSSSPLQAETRFVPKMTKADYHVFPSIAELGAMSEADIAAVSGFKVERHGFGSVEWDGAVDVRGVDIDTVVVIESKNVSVYDKAEETGEKPEQGSKLNRPAVITMFDIFPKEGAESSPEAKAKLRRKIEKSTKKMGAELLSFEEESGVWKFRVGHFSRYGLDDDSEEESDDGTPLMVDDEQENLKPTEYSTELGGSSKMHAPMDEDESTSASETLHLIESEEDTCVNEIVRAGEEAYTMMAEEVLQDCEDYEEEEVKSVADEMEKVRFPNEAFDDTGPGKCSLRPVALAPLPMSSVGICSKLADKCGLNKTSSSNFDLGMRMSRSTRVGWRPDGSFVRLGPNLHRDLEPRNQILIQSRPVTNDSSSTSARLLKTHQKHSIKATEETEKSAPIFTLPKSIKHRSERFNQSLFDALEEYSSAECDFNSATQQVVSSSFSLLISLYGDDMSSGSGSISESCRQEAVTIWLQQVIKAIDLGDAASLSSNIYGSIFTALSRGDTATASSLALDGGNPHLSLMLSNTGVQAQPFCDGWDVQSTSSDILRIVCAATGSIDVERNRVRRNVSDIDWRRYFCLLLGLCSNSDDQATLSSIIKQYGSDVSADLAPPAMPLYCDKLYRARISTTATNQCILYQILNHYADAKVPLTGILAPSSHSPCKHDFSASFHLGASLTAISRSTLKHHQENLITDAVTSQLIGEGQWEWAVYASLCFIGGGIVSGPTAFAKQLAAKKIISMFYSPSTDSSAESRRSFLQNLGIPSEWFIEAHTHRCISQEDFFAMAKDPQITTMEHA